MSTSIADSLKKKAEVKYLRRPTDNIYTAKGDLISSSGGVFTPKTAEEEALINHFASQGLLVEAEGV